MSTQSDEQLDKLFAAARAARPDTARMEFGFETRLLARLRADLGRSAAGAWCAWAWRLLPGFAAVVLAMGVWTFAANGGASVDWSAGMAESGDAQLLVTYFTGE